ncbi:PHB depolymerase family esterase [Caballeronia novacaledonica]|uniref:PHB depolymerase family esterase n=1 Tax=Caballeronia novacaledonica TaxID=1544861 RepID=A0AA37IJP8_9BURK|nr:PHB depolymerase family esterase [Caballeronia novacaledonica]GJH30902.1 PHB depolymerase family esterase [Caballeronia novacaledonica]
MKNINATAVMHNSGHPSFDSSSSPLIGLFVSRVANDVVEAADFDSCSPEAQKKTTRALQPGPQWLSGRFSHPTGVHDFKVYVPANYRGAPTSLIVMLHGASQDADDFALGTGMNLAAESGGCIVVYPEQGTSANMFRCWNWFRPADQVRDSGEASVIAGITREVMACYEIDPTRVFIAGMSAGAAMAVNLAVTHPDLYSAAGIHSGLAFGVADEAFSAMTAMRTGTCTAQLSAARDAMGVCRAVPLIVFHGDQDTTVHPLNAQGLMQMHRSLMLGTDEAYASVTTELGQVEQGYPYTRNTYRRSGGGEVFGEQWLIHGLGHAWSGGDPNATHTDAQGPNAAREMMRFFEAVADSR